LGVTLLDFSVEFLDEVNELSVVLLVLVYVCKLLLQPRVHPILDVIESAL